MILLPFKNLIYETKLDPDEVLTRIQGILEPKQNLRPRVFFASYSSKPYEGKVNGKTFKMNRILRYKNSFLPQITGEVQQGLGKTKVLVKMRLNWFVLIFISIWIAFFLFGIIPVFNGPIWGANTTASFLPITMVVFGYGLTIAAFNYESVKSKNYIAKLLEANISNLTN